MIGRERLTNILYLKNYQKSVKNLPLKTKQQLTIFLRSCGHRPGDQLRLVFEEGKIGLSEIISPADQSVRLIELLTDSSELPVQVTVAVGFPKCDKLDFIVENQLN